MLREYLQLNSTLKQVNFLYGPKSRIHQFEQLRDFLLGTYKNINIETHLLREGGGGK